MVVSLCQIKCCCICCHPEHEPKPSSSLEHDTSIDSSLPQVNFPFNPIVPQHVVAACATARRQRAHRSGTYLEGPR